MIMGLYQKMKSVLMFIVEEIVDSTAIVFRNKPAVDPTRCPHNISNPDSLPIPESLPVMRLD